LMGSVFEHRKRRLVESKIDTNMMKIETELQI